MATQSMFGNQYQQAIIDEQNQRRNQAQTGGLTGWAAITNAMSGIGSEIGFEGGQAMGGMTPAQMKQANYQSIIDSVPDFDPTNSDSVSQMASAMWTGGEYDMAMQFYDRSQDMKAANLQVDIAEIKLKNLQNPDRKMTQLGDGYFYWTDTLSSAEGPQRVASSIVKKTEQKSAEFQALNQKRDELIKEHGETLGNEKFLEYAQGLDVETASAGTKNAIGTTIFQATMKNRDAIADKLGKISTGISQFAQAKSGSAAAGEIAETLIAQIFEDKRQATSEIRRIASAGNLVENVTDFANTVFSGVKTAEHYQAFIKTLQIYEQEQMKKYNSSNESLKQIGIDYSFDVPDSVFEVYTPRDGSTKEKIKQWNPETQTFDLVDR
jgi:hypothetical protein